MNCIFDEPVWKITQAATAATFAYAGSKLVVTPQRGRPTEKHINVPSPFFSMAEVVLLPAEMHTARKNGVSFFLEQDERGDWYFGFEVNKTSCYRYLWRYTANKVPGWMVAVAV